MSTALPDSYSFPDSRHSLPLVLSVLLLIFFFLSFFSIYFCRYITDVSWFDRQDSADGREPLSDSTPPRGGLHPTIIAAFPTFTYALVKDHHRGKCGLECAVCLCEFSDDDVLRLLTTCDHAFHIECIDLWFESHATCPVCRRKLDPESKSPEKTPEVRGLMPENEAQVEEVVVVAAASGESQESVRVSFKEEGVDTTGARSERMEHVVSIDRLPRSHSTGHSLVDDDRFTLRLPENLRERIVRERNWTGSCCIVFRDLSEPPNAETTKQEDAIETSRPT